MITEDSSFIANPDKSNHEWGGRCKCLNAVNSKENGTREIEKEYREWNIEIFVIKVEQGNEVLLEGDIEPETSYFYFVFFKDVKDYRTLVCYWK